MADRKPRTGELTTANYGWTKPTVGASDDQWGGYLNANLDGIDGTVKGVSNVANAAYPASNPAGYVTAAAIPAPYVLPTASTTVLGGVKVDGTTIHAAVDGTISSAGGGGIADAPSDSTAYMRSNAAWSSGGVVRNALTVGVASGSVDALVITPGAASSLPAKIDSSTAGSGVQISSSWTAFKSGGQALLTAQGNGSVIGIGQGNPNFLTFQNNSGGAVLEIMDQTSANASVGSVVQIFNAPTGNPSTAIIQADGVSANRGIQLVPNGTGTIQAPTMAQTDSSTAVATTAFVHSAVIGDNRIINGDMRIDQRGVASGGGGTAVGYMCDRWQFLASLATKGGWGTGVNPSAFPYQLGFTSNSAYTLLAGDYFTFMQAIEADMISDFMWGTASARPVTLSFQVQSSLTGTFGGAIRNYASNRSYPFSYSIPVANVWTPVSITIPGDTGGTWVLHGNVGAAQLCFGFGCGSSLTAPAGAWVGSGAVSANGCVSILGTNGANFFVTGVKLEIGSVATPYNRQSLAKSMADCQRYYYATGNAVIGGAAVSGSTQNNPFLLPVMMRAGPTVTPTLTGGSGYSSFAVQNANPTVVGIYVVPSAAWYSSTLTFTASAEI